MITALSIARSLELSRRKAVSSKQWAVGGGQIRADMMSNVRAFGFNCPLFFAVQPEPLELHLIG
jgi:hypothetical protein